MQFVYYLEKSGWTVALDAISLMVNCERQTFNGFRLTAAYSISDQ